MNDEAVVSPAVADGFIELHLNQMSHISRSWRLINTVVVGRKRQKCAFFHPLLFLKYESNFFYPFLIHPSRTESNMTNSEGWLDLHFCSTQQHHSLLALFALLCPCNFPHRVLHVGHLYLRRPGSGTQANILEKTMVDLKCETPESMLRPWTSNLWSLWIPDMRKRVGFQAI